MKIAVVIGTRPEAIKLWPVVLELRKRNHDVTVISTGQQEDLLEPIMEELDLGPDVRCEDWQPACRSASGRMIASIGEMLGYMTANLGRHFTETEYQLVLVQGDTITALAGALAAFYTSVPVGHVEAGLRTRDITNPFPEEGNRQMISRVARLHFCPTREAAFQLSMDGIDETGIITGNTVVDALKMISRLPVSDLPDPANILVTFHRRESWPLVRQVAESINYLAKPRRVRWYLHANPTLQNTIRAHAPDVELLPPSGYRKFIAELSRADCVITDSGGVIEEATVLGKPLIILRNDTERPEAFDAIAVMVSPAEHGVALEKAVRKVLAETKVPSNVFGDGTAAQKIADEIEQWAE